MLPLTTPPGPVWYGAAHQPPRLAELIRWKKRAVVVEIPGVGVKTMPRSNCHATELDALQEQLRRAQQASARLAEIMYECQTKIRKLEKQK